jgi:nitrogen regulatory protein P-II 1
MKKIEAILSPHIVEEVSDLLVARGCYDIVVSGVKSNPSNGGRPMRYRGIAYMGDIPKLKLETIVADGDAMATAHAILTASQNGNASKQTVSVSALEAVVSIGVSKLDDQIPLRRAS